MKRIPHISHRYWDQGWENMPAHLATMCDGFDALHPGWQHERWDRQRVLDEVDLREGHQLFLNASDYVPPDSVPQMRADIARYAIARQFGGVTLDTDYYWHKAIDDLLPKANIVLCHEVDGGWIANGFLAANPKHTLLTRVLAGMPENAESLVGKGLRANTFTGPKYLTPIVRALGAREDLRLLPAKTFHPVPWNRPQDAHHHQRYTSSYAVHAWAHQRGLKGIDKGIWRTWDESADAPAEAV